MTNEEAKKYEEKAKAITGIYDDTRFRGMYNLGAEKSREAGLLYEKAYDLGGSYPSLFRAEHFLRIACDIERDHGPYVEGYNGGGSPTQDHQNSRSHDDLVRVCLKREL